MKRMGLLMLLGLGFIAQAETYDCGKKTCSQMKNCAEAQYKLRQCGQSRLDRDHDGIPCESICGG